MVLELLAQEAVPASLWNYILDTIVRVGGAIMVVAAVTGVGWKWFGKDRWEKSVQTAAAAAAEPAEAGDANAEHQAALADQVMTLSTGVREHVTTVVGNLKDDLNEHLDRIESLERTVQNGLSDEMDSVRQDVTGLRGDVQALIAGQGRLEGMMQMLTQRGGNHG